jgi:hypothetical protein
MGKGVNEKALLAMLPLWANESQEPIPSILVNKVADWVENSQNSAIKNLWNQTKQKRIITDANSA